jgi:hypothetical protein
VTEGADSGAPRPDCAKTCLVSRRGADHFGLVRCNNGSRQKQAADVPRNVSKLPPSFAHDPNRGSVQTDGASGPGRTNSPKTCGSGPREIPHSKSVPVSLCPQSRRCGISPLVAPQAPAAHWVSSLDAVGATSQRKWSMIPIEACLVASGTRLRSWLRPSPSPT